jgi:hypothetical protein
MKKRLFALLVLALTLALAVPLVGCDSEDLTDGLSQAVTLITRTITVDNVPPSVTGGTDHEFCSEDPEEWDQWHFVITDLDPTEATPEYMTAVLDGVGGIVISLEKVTPGGVAHYRLEGEYLDATLLEGYAELDEAATYNRFNLSHAPCGGSVQPQAVSTVVKFFDGNANGVLDVDEPLLNGWYFTIDGALYSTLFSGTVDVGVHNITELMPDELNWVASGIVVDGTENYEILSNTRVEVTLEENDDVTIYFGNYCLVPSGGFAPGYWSQVVMSGYPLVPTSSRRISDELYGIFVDYITNVNPVTLVNNDGSPASFSDALTLSQWIGSGLNAANMAAQLSRHTAAMILNILSGAVNGIAYYIPAEMAAQEIVDAAKALLNASPIIIEAGELRDEAEQLKDWLDELNNGADVVPPESCPYTFTL